MVEFALVFILFVGLLLAMFDFAFLVWTRGTLHHAVREGVRFAITGTLLPGYGHDDSIRQIVMRNAPGMIDDPNAITIEYFRPACNSGCGSGVNGAGNIIVVSVDSGGLQTIGPVSGYGAKGPFRFTVAAVDKMEPIAGAPPPRVLPPPPI